MLMNVEIEARDNGTYNWFVWSQEVPQCEGSANASSPEQALRDAADWVELNLAPPRP